MDKSPQLCATHVYIIERVACGQVDTPMSNRDTKHLLKADRLPDKLDRRRKMRPPSRLMLNGHVHPTFYYDSVAAATQPVDVRRDVHRPVDLHAMATLMAYGIYALMLKMATGRVIVVGEVLLMVDNRPLTRAVDPVLDLREQHPIIVNHR